MLIHDCSCCLYISLKFNKFTTRGLVFVKDARLIA